MRFFLLGVLAIFLVIACSEQGPVETIQVDPLKQVDTGQFRDRHTVLNFTSIGDSLRRTGDLYTMIFYGDYSQILDFQHQKNLMVLKSKQRKVGCSMFAAHSEQSAPLCGRNFDNIETDLLVGFYFPPGKLRSIGFTPLKFIGFKPGEDVTGLEPVRQAALIYAPYFIAGGINEKGIAVGLHAVRPRQYEPDDSREFRYVTHWQREILDNAADLETALEIALKFNVFDNGLDTITHNLFICAPSGESAIVEFHDGKLEVIRSSENWQVMTNSLRLVKNPPHCSRYQRASRFLEGQQGNISPEQAMDLLKRISQRTIRYSTQWSAVFDLEKKEIRLCLDRNYRKIYTLTFPDI